MSLPNRTIAETRLEWSSNRAAAARPFYASAVFARARYRAFAKIPRRSAGINRSALCVNLRMTPITVTNSPFDIPAKRKSFTLLTSGTTSSTALDLAWKARPIHFAGRADSLLHQESLVQKAPNFGRHMRLRQTDVMGEVLNRDAVGFLSIRHPHQTAN